MKALSYLEISRTALRHNYQALAGITTSEVVPVVKASAYGHGLREVVTSLSDLAPAFQVDDIEEAREVHALAPEAQILIYGYIRTVDLAEAVDLGAEIAIYEVQRLQTLAQLADQGKPVKLALKVDALLGRQGLLPDEIPAFLDALKGYPKLGLTSIYAHYANIEDTTDLTHAEAQEEAFLTALEPVRRCFPDAIVHFSATSGLLTREASKVPTGRVRAGIGLYGLYPSAPLARSHAELGLRPALRWISHLAQVKTLPAGHPVGYGLTYRAKEAMRVGIVPQGYSDGYDRGLSNVGEVLVGGRRCPVIGRVAMNMFAIDLSAVPEAKAEDEVVLLGSQGEERISAEEIALQLGTINYEVVARLSPLLPKVVVEDLDSLWVCLHDAELGNIPTECEDCTLEFELGFPQESPTRKRVTFEFKNVIRLDPLEKLKEFVEKIDLERGFEVMDAGFRQEGKSFSLWIEGYGYVRRVETKFIHPVETEFLDFTIEGDLTIRDESGVVMTIDELMELGNTGWESWEKRS